MTIDEIREKLIKAFPKADVELINTSSMHIGHNSRGYHLKTVIKYSGFNGISIIEQHRMVQKVLEDELGTTIHALSIKTISKKQGDV